MRVGDGRWKVGECARVGWEECGWGVERCVMCEDRKERGVAVPKWGV